MKAIKPVAIVTALLSTIAWTYRFIDENSRFEEILLYVLVPAVIWIVFAAPLFALRSNRKIIRVVAAILLVPTALLWLLSILVGFYGLKIH